jgi:hypothetical protein
MRRPGWDARRRNKNIGTSKSGHGQNNRMKIPISRKFEQSYCENLENLVAIVRRIGDHKITILVEPVRAGFIHACTPDDIMQILSLIPPRHIESIDLLVLRQPKHKEYLLCPVWGRLQYWSKIRQYAGVAIYLDAQPVETVFRWHKSLCPDDLQELERLVQDGHRVISERRYYAIYTDLESTRNTQLYRTLLHEVGHYVDYFKSVQKDETSDVYWSKPGDEKEAFAHRYADQFCEKKRKAGHIPFERILNEERIVADGLALSWFVPQNISVGTDISV